MSVKRKLTTKSLGEKCNALKDLENGMSNKEVPEKYGVPKNTISTWLKNWKTKTSTVLLQTRPSFRKNKMIIVTHFVLLYLTTSPLVSCCLIKRVQIVPI